MPNLQSFRYLPSQLDLPRQRQLLASIKGILADAPLFQPVMPRTGQPFSVRMSNCGPLGWVSDRAGGYRYQATHPETGRPWPSMPDQLLALWSDLTGYPAAPEACLINFYAGKAKMGAHVDRDEADRSAPVLSVSLGDSAIFHVGGLKRTDPKTRVTLKSGDVLILEGPSRFAYHGIDRVLPNTSDLLAESGLAEGGLAAGRRLNLTLRRVTVPASL